MRLPIIQWMAALAAFAIAGGAASAAPVVKAVQIGVFQRPTFLAAAPGAPTLLFVVEQGGKIRVLVNEKQTASFLNISDLVLGPPDASAGGEQGLLSIAFAPDYAQSKLFYVFFVNLKGNLEVDEFQRSASPLQAKRSTRRVLLDIPHPGATNHNGGQMQFGPDGFLYISTGDGGNTATPGEPARNLDNLLGKLLRIDPFHKTGSLPYAIPPTNPFVNKAGRDQIYAYGFRNPWRFAFDNQWIAIGDVGQSRQEEVDLLKAANARGVNFGWPQYEGKLVYDSSRAGPGPARFPMFTYDHNNGRCAIIGGLVAHDPDLPSLSGRYLYGDACNGAIRSFVPNVAAQTVAGDQPTGVVLPGLSSFGRSGGGKIYVAQTSGAVSRLERAP
jgi:glucose/arabinose dehydrogenase